MYALVYKTRENDILNWALKWTLNPTQISLIPVWPSQPRPMGYAQRGPPPPCVCPAQSSHSVWDATTRAEGAPPWSTFPLHDVPHGMSAFPHANAPGAWPDLTLGPSSSFSTSKTHAPLPLFFFEARHHVLNNRCRIKVEEAQVMVPDLTIFT
jgi:hypothetical protein